MAMEEDKGKLPRTQMILAELRSIGDSPCELAILKSDEISRLYERLFRLWV